MFGRVVFVLFIIIYLLGVVALSFVFKMVGAPLFGEKPSVWAMLYFLFAAGTVMLVLFVGFLITLRIPDHCHEWNACRCTKCYKTRHEVSANCRCVHCNEYAHDVSITYADEGGFYYRMGICRRCNLELYRETIERPSDPDAHPAGCQCYNCVPWGTPWCH